MVKITQNQKNNSNNNFSDITTRRTRKEIEFRSDIDKLFKKNDLDEIYVCLFNCARHALDPLEFRGRSTTDMYGLGNIEQYVRSQKTEYGEYVSIINDRLSRYFMDEFESGRIDSSKISELVSSTSYQFIMSFRETLSQQISISRDNRKINFKNALSQLDNKISTHYESLIISKDILQRIENSPNKEYREQKDIISGHYKGIKEVIYTKCIDGDIDVRVNVKNFPSYIHYRYYCDSNGIPIFGSMENPY